MERLRRITVSAVPALFGLAVGFLVLYGFGLVIGAYGPGEMPGWTVAAAILVAFVAWYAHRVHVALAHRDPEMMRALNQARERRGF